MIKHLLKTGDCTRKSDITLRDHFTQLIYVVRYSLYPWSTLASDSEMSHEPVLIIVRFAHEWYEVGLLWFKENSEMPDHYNLCFNWLRYLQGRLIKEPGILVECQCYKMIT